MEYNNKEIFNTAKKIVADMQDLKEESITEDACSFYWDLDLDSLGKYEFLMKMEKHYKVSVETKDVEIFEQSKTLKEFCDIFCDYLNPKEIDSKNDVFKILDEHLKDKYGIMNARPTDNFFIDLHFQDFDRSDLIAWADKTFNIILQRTYFINLDDFCEKIFYAIQRKKTHQLKNNKGIKTYTEQDIFEIVSNHLSARYSINQVKPESNWYTDLRMDADETLEFFAWIKEKFAIYVTAMNFTTVGNICKQIYKKLPEKHKQQKPNLFNRAKQRFNNLVQKINQYSK